MLSQAHSWLAVIGEAPIGPKLSTDAGNFGVWAIEVVAAVFFIPHFLQFFGACWDRIMFAWRRGEVDGFTLSAYVETRWVFLQAIVIAAFSVAMLAILHHYHDLR